MQFFLSSVWLWENPIDKFFIHQRDKGLVLKNVLKKMLTYKI